MTKTLPTASGTHRKPLQGDNGDNKLQPSDRPVHDWYRFVLSFPPHLVRDYIERFAVRPGQCVLDPFCGTGTTLVECKKLGIESIGIEAHPMLFFASKVKVNWRPHPHSLVEHARAVAERALAVLADQDISDDPLDTSTGVTHQPLLALPPESSQLLLAGSISPLPLHKTLVLLRCLADHWDDRFGDHERLALAKALVSGIGNLHFGPEVGAGKPKTDAPVVSTWLRVIEQMADDLRHLREETRSTVFWADSRSLENLLKPQSVDAVITSPPYPNEKDYTRTTRLESVLLGFLRNKADLRSLKRMLIRSNTRTVYKEDQDDRWVAGHPEIERLSREIEARRVQLGKTSGFERLYPRVTRLYFGGMARHLAGLRSVLRPGAKLAYVVGDQASYLRVMIRTGSILADIAQSLGYEVLGIDLFRTRLATATRQQIREEVVVLRWPGESSSHYVGW